MQRTKVQVAYNAFITVDETDDTGKYITFKTVSAAKIINLDYSLVLSYILKTSRKVWLDHKIFNCNAIIVIIQPACNIATL